MTDLEDVVKRTIIILIFLFTAAVFLSARSYLNDDSVISYRYVQNLNRGWGLAPWEGSVPVEGYSNTSLVLGTAIISKTLGITSLQSIFQVGVRLNFLAALGILILLLVWNRKEMGPGWIAALPVVLLAIFYPFAYACGSGLETMLYAFFLTAMAMAYTRGSVTSGALAGLAVALTRPEGVFIALFCAILATVFPVTQTQTIRKRFRIILLWFALPVALFFLWRVWYFGAWLPNTATVKTSGINDWMVWKKGATYVTRAIFSPTLVTVLAGLTVWRIAWRSGWRKYRFEALIIASQLGFAAAVGGDAFHFGPYRFVLPIFPLLFRSGSIVLASIQGKKRQFALATLLCLTLPLTYHTWNENWNVFWRQEAKHLIAQPESFLKMKSEYFLHPHEWIDAEAGKLVASLVPENGRNLSMASCQAGSLPIHWKGEFHDLAGLLSPDYAHATDKDAAFRANPPDIVISLRWQRGWWPVPSVKTLKALGYEPLILIRLIENAGGEGMRSEYIINFMVFVRDRSILTGLKDVQWEYAAGAAYEDETGKYDQPVLVKEIRLNRGI